MCRGEIGEQEEKSFSYTPINFLGGEIDSESDSPMDRKTVFALSIVGCMIISSISLHFYIARWLEETGIGQLESGIMDKNLVCLFLDVASLASFFIFRKQMGPAFLSVMAYIIGTIGLFLLYLGLYLSFNPAIFVSSLRKPWSDGMNNGNDEKISRNFKCCGFYKLTDYPSGSCKYRKQVPCYNAMVKSIEPNILSMGISIIGLSLGHLISCLLLALSAYSESSLLNIHQYAPNRTGLYGGNS